MKNILFTDESVKRQITDSISENLTASDLESTVHAMQPSITSHYWPSAGAVQMPSTGTTAICTFFFAHLVVFLYFEGSNNFEFLKF